MTCVLVCRKIELCVVACIRIVFVIVALQFKMHNIQNETQANTEAGRGVE